MCVCVCLRACVCACQHETSKLVALLIFWLVKQDPGCGLGPALPSTVWVRRAEREVCVFTSSFLSSLSRFTALEVHLKLM